MGRTRPDAEIKLEAIRRRTWGVCETLQTATAEAFRQRGIDYLQGNTPTYSFAYKYAAFDGLRRLAARIKGGRHDKHETSAAHLQHDASTAEVRGG